MAKFEITIKDDPRQQLTPISVGRASVFEADIFNVPETMESVQLHIGTPTAEGTFLPATAIARSDARWYCYCSGLYFPNEGAAKYHITGIDSRGGSHWLGSGALRILPSVLFVPDGDVPIIPDDTYVRDPDTGLWHKLTVSFVNGQLIPEIEKEGVSR